MTILITILLLTSLASAQILKHATPGLPLTRLCLLILSSLAISGGIFCWVNSAMVSQWHLQYLNTAIICLASGASLLGGQLLMQRGWPSWQFLAVPTFYCVLAISLVLNTASAEFSLNYPPAQKVAVYLAIGGGFIGGLIAWAEFDRRVGTTRIPAAFRGAPIWLICVAFAALGFSGLAGMV